MATTWGSAIAAGRARLLAVGDSWVEGYGASTRANSWVPQLAAALRARHGLPAAASAYLYAERGLAATNYSWTAGVPTRGGSTGWVEDGGDDWGIHQADYGSAMWEAGAYVQWSVTGSSFDVITDGWEGAGAGTATVAVDGVTVGTVSNGATDGSGTVTHFVFSTAGTHTVRIAWSSGVALVSGIFVYDGETPTHGVSWWNSGHCGFGAQMFGPPGPQSLAWEILDPHLVVDELVSLNDFITDVAAGSALTAAAAASALGGRIARYRDLPSDPTIVCVAPPSTMASFSLAGTNSLGSTWVQYRTSWLAAAAAAGVHVLDLDDVWPTGMPAGSSSTSSYPSGGLHPNDTGHQQIATALADLLDDLDQAETVYVGSDAPSAVYLGTSPVAALHVGDTKVYG